MSDKDILSLLNKLTKQLLNVTSDPELPSFENWWPIEVTIALRQANARLHSIQTVLSERDYESAVILTRSLFELEVNLAYSAKDIDVRLPEYLRHAGIPLTKEDAEEMLVRLESDPYNFLPRRAWKNLKTMCEDLGSSKVGQYETLYGLSSIPTHAGAFNHKQYLQNLLSGGPPAIEIAIILYTALALHILIARTSAIVFPKSINTDQINALKNKLFNIDQAFI